MLNSLLFSLIIDLQILKKLTYDLLKTNHFNPHGEQNVKQKTPNIKGSDPCESLGKI